MLANLASKDMLGPQGDQDSIEKKLTPRTVPGVTKKDDSENRPQCHTLQKEKGTRRMNGYEKTRVHALF